MYRTSGTYPVLVRYKIPGIEAVRFVFMFVRGRRNVVVPSQDDDGIMIIEC